MKKIFLGIGVCLFCSIILSENASAASFESMKENVDNGEGLVYNPISEGFMTEESSKKYVEIIEKKLLENQEEAKEDILPEVMEETYVETQDLEVLASETLPEPPAITSRGANIPTATRFLDERPMNTGSNIFSGSGWRYSGYRFTFRNMRANPYFAVVVSGDSFYFHNIYGGKEPVYPGYTYYFDSVKPGAAFLTYFSTLNPVYGSKYYIW